MTDTRLLSSRILLTDDMKGLCDFRELLTEIRKSVFISDHGTTSDILSEAC